MQRPNNETTNNSLEDQWAVVLDAYEGEPNLAFIMAKLSSNERLARDWTIRSGTGHQIV